MMNNNQRKEYLHALGVPLWRSRFELNTAEPQLDEAAVTLPDQPPTAVSVLPKESCALPVVIEASVAAGIKTCVRCKRHESRTNVVIGRGSEKAALMLICEAPTLDEDLLGQSIVHKADVLLANMFRAIGLGERDLYITPYVKCRSGGINDPKAEEAAACFAHLETEICTVNPQMLVVFGRNVARFLFDTAAPFDELRGQVHAVTVNGRNYPTVATYSPNLLLRLPREKVKSWADLKLIHKTLVNASGQ